MKNVIYVLLFASLISTGVLGYMVFRNHRYPNIEIKEKEVFKNDPLVTIHTEYINGMYSGDDVKCEQTADDVATCPHFNLYLSLSKDGKGWFWVSQRTTETIPITGEYEIVDKTIKLTPTSYLRSETGLINTKLTAAELNLFFTELKIKDSNTLTISQNEKLKNIITLTRVGGYSETHIKTLK